VAAVAAGVMVFTEFSSLTLSRRTPVGRLRGSKGKEEDGELDEGMVWLALSSFPPSVMMTR